MMHRYVLLIPTLVGMAVLFEIPASSVAQATAPPNGACAPDSFGAAVATDTARLRHRTHDLPVGASTDGGEATVYYLNGKPRVVVVLYGGEMGEQVDRYFLTSPTSYVFVSDRERYYEPLTVQANPRVRTRLPVVLYVCGESVRGDPTGGTDAKTMQHALDAAVMSGRP